MKTYDVSNFDPVFLTADAVVFHDNKVLLIERKKDPYMGRWALPGGFFDVSVDLDICEAARRELLEETCLELPLSSFVEIGVFSKKGRDPREQIASRSCRIVSVAFYAEIENVASVCARDDAARVEWFPLSSLPKLAFDHEEIIALAIKKGLIRR